MNHSWTLTLECDQVAHQLATALVERGFSISGPLTYNLLEIHSETLQIVLALIMEQRNAPANTLYCWSARKVQNHFRL